MQDSARMSYLPLQAESRHTTAIHDVGADMHLNLPTLAWVVMAAMFAIAPIELNQKSTFVN